METPRPRLQPVLLALTYVSACGKKWLPQDKCKTSAQGIWEESVSQGISWEGWIET